MRISDYYFTPDEMKCPDCGAQTTCVYYYRGRRVGHEVHQTESLTGRTRTTTDVTTYADVALQTARYCERCKKKKEDAQWARRSKPDPQAEAERKRKRKLTGLAELLLAIGLPVGLGFATSAAIKAGGVQDSSLSPGASILMLLTIGAALLAIRLLFDGFDRLKNEDLSVITANLRERAMAYPPAETEIIRIMTAQRKDPDVVFFTKSEYQKLQRR